MTFRLTNIELVNGESFDPGKLLVVVGPNNSGKSQFLRDLKTQMVGNQNTGIIVKKIDAEIPVSIEELNQMGIFFLRGPQPHTFLIQYINADLLSAGNTSWSVGMDITEQTFFTAHIAGVEKKMNLNHFGSGLFCYASTENRLSSLSTTQSGSPESGAQNIMQAFYHQPEEKETEIREIVFSAFNVYPRLDISALSTLCIRIGNEQILQISNDPRKSYQQFQAYPKLEDQGDGIRSFMYLVSALKLMQRPVTLIDEPEAFLHPPQARILGKFIAGEARRDRQIIISTHSSDIIEAIISENPDVTIMRISRDENITKNTFLQASDIKEISSHSHLNSSRTLNGLFYGGVLVSEADADRLFYSSASNFRHKDKDIYYTNGNGKQSLVKMMNSYKKMSLPCAVVVDFDLLRNVNDVERFITAAGVDINDKQEILSAQKNLELFLRGECTIEAVQEKTEECIESLKNINYQLGTAETVIRHIKRISNNLSSEIDNWRSVKKKGLSALSGSILESTSRALDKLMKYGIFVVPVGELESWIDFPNLSEKNEWLAFALPYLNGKDLALHQKLDVFMDKIHGYLQNAAR